MEDSALAVRLKVLRREQGFTQLEISSQLNISNTTLSQYESGKRRPSFTILKQLAEIYACSCDYLLGNSDEYIQAAPVSISTLSEDELQSLCSLKQLDSVFFSQVCDCVKLSDRDMNTLKNILGAYILDRAQIY